jgi:hypothetical protein
LYGRRSLLRFGLHWLHGSLRFGLLLHVEEHAAGRAHIENRRCPLLTETTGEERFAGLGDGGVNGVSLGNGFVELFGEGLGCVIADLKLHGDDGGQALLTQALGDAGEGVLIGLAGAFAGVEDGESEAVVIAENGAEKLAAHRVGHAPGVYELENAVTCGLVEAAVTDEVKDVEWLTTGAVAKVVEGCAGQALELDGATGFEFCKRGLEALPFALCVEARQVAWASEDDEDTEWRADLKGGDAVRKVEITDHWRGRGGGEEVVLRPVVKELPWKLGEGGDAFEAQTDAKAAAVFVTAIHAGAELAE